MRLIIILITVYIFTQRNYFKNMLFLLLMFNLYNVNIGYIAVLGGIGITYIDFITIAMAFACFIKMKNSYEVDKSIISAYILLALSIVVGVIFLFFFPSSSPVLSYTGNWDSYFKGNTAMLASPTFSKQSILQFIRLTVFVYIISIVKREVTIEEWRALVGKLIRSSWYMLPLFLIEFFTVLTGSDLFTKTRNTLFDFWYIDMEKRLCGFSTEPSYYAISIFLIIAMNMLCLRNEVLNSKEKRAIYVIISLYFVIGFFSGAFSFLLAVVALVILFLKEKLTRKGMVLFVMAIGLAISVVAHNFTECTKTLLNSDVTVLNRLGNTFSAIIAFFTGSNIVYTSESTRILSIFITGKAWLTRPLFGLGIGTTVCFSGIVSILATIGVVGFLLWYHLVFHCYPNKNNSEFYYLIFLLIYLPAGDFELIYGFNIILWIQMITLLSKDNDMVYSGG